MHWFTQSIFVKSSNIEFIQKDAQGDQKMVL
uniref:Uncharacterized protein n=1 Tax=Arundo donax TaxID=35708 RepID=A0A0A9DNI6_ARUDO